MPGTVVTLAILLWFFIGLTVWLIRGNWNMGAEVARLQEEVEENGSVIDSTIVVLSGLANRLREALMAEDSLDQISTLADELDANSARLAAAVAANTVSENDSNEFDVSELEEAEEVSEADLSEVPDFSAIESEDAGVGESADGVTSATPEAQPSASDDTVSAVDVATESESDQAPGHSDEGSEDETPTAA